MMVSKPVQKVKSCAVENPNSFQPDIEFIFEVNLSLFASIKTLVAPNMFYGHF